MNRHSKYLHPQLVVMALVSDKLTPGEKKAIAEALLAVKEDFNVKKVNKDYTKFHVLDAWPEGEFFSCHICQQRQLVDASSAGLAGGS